MAISRRERAFTLIELMIVVAFFAILAAVVVPAAIRARDRGREAPVAAQPEQAPERPAGGALPVFDSVQVDMGLEARQQRVGMDVFNRFQVAYEGQFRVRSPGGAVRLEFPFPRGTAEASGVSLQFVTGEGRSEPEGVVYDRWGIFWQGELPHQPVTAEVRFVAQGRERFELALPPAERLRSVQIHCTLDGISTRWLPDTALQPTEVGPGRLSWRFESLVTGRPLVVELRGARSPLGQVIRLFKLMGLAVLLFGAGFWYLGDLYEAGVLDRFRWGHFLLLATTYSLFFVVFAVLGFREDGSPGRAMAVAAVLSLPLLVLHVGRIVDLRFALTRVLPLALFTLGLVVNGVYGGAWRDPVFLAGAFLTVAFVTLTWRRWSTGREIHQRRLEQRVLDRAAALAEVFERAREAELQAGRRLARPDPGELAGERREVEERRSEVREVLKERLQVEQIVAELRSCPDSWPRMDLRRALEARVRSLEERLPRVERALREVGEWLEARRDEVSVGEAPGEAHCLACGRAHAGSPFCPHCGTPRPRRLECPRCASVVLLPVHLLRDRVPETCCVRCGEPHPAA